MPLDAPSFLVALEFTLYQLIVFGKSIDVAKSSVDEALLLAWFAQL